MAVMVPDKPSMMDYMINNLQAFIFECGRTQGILQSDNEDTLNTLLKATAVKVGSMTVRHVYSSNSQGSVERLRRTLLEQARVVKAQVESNPEDPILKKINLKIGLEEGPIPIECWSNMSPAHPVEDQYRYWSRLVQIGQRILVQIGQDIGPDWSC